MANPKISWLITAGLSLFFLLFSCSDRYPFFLQEPDFAASPAVDSSGTEHPGIFLEISCEDPHAQIRYTLDGSEPGRYHGLLYAEPLYLAAESVIVRAVAVRSGYDPGPVGEYYYEP